MSIIGIRDTGRLEVGVAIPDTVDELLELWGVGDRWGIELLNERWLRGPDVVAREDLPRPPYLPTRIGERVQIGVVVFYATDHWKVRRFRIVTDEPAVGTQECTLDDYDEIMMRPGDQLRLHVHLTGRS